MSALRSAAVPALAPFYSAHARVHILPTILSESHICGYLPTRKYECRRSHLLFIGNASHDDHQLHLVRWPSPCREVGLPASLLQARAVQRRPDFGHSHLDEAHACAQACAFVPACSCACLHY